MNFTRSKMGKKMFSAAPAARTIYTAAGRPRHSIHVCGLNGNSTVLIQGRVKEAVEHLPNAVLNKGECNLRDCDSNIMDFSV